MIRRRASPPIGGAVKGRSSRSLFVQSDDAPGPSGGMESEVSAAVAFLVESVADLEVGLEDSPSSSSTDSEAEAEAEEEALPPEEKRARQKRRRKERAGKRRHIKAILDSSKLSSATISAQQQEKDRLARLELHRRAAMPAVPMRASPALSSDSDEIMILSGDDGDGAMEEDEAGPSYAAGDYTDDRENVADASGRLLVNPAHEPDDPDIFIADHLSAKLKPHQLGGVRFMYNNIVEDLDHMRTSDGLGCVLAHSMGLGKTLQVISFTDVLFRHTRTKRVVIIVPVNTLQNWIQEFDKWLPEKPGRESEVEPRRFRVFLVNETCKTIEQRAAVIRSWYNKGGVLVLGYEMFRRMVNKDLQTPAAKYREAEARRLKKRRLDVEAAIMSGIPVPGEVVDIEEEEIQSSLSELMKEALLDPGPDVIICDEGHRIKNLKTGTARVMNSIRTRRRIVMTGSPLQNNLNEYWCMVDFVRPKFLGSRLEFLNMFERPIHNGQCSDSTPADKHLARQRTHVLTNMLKGFVQRRGHGLLHCILPQKREWVLWMRKSPVQRRLYSRFLAYCAGESESCNPLKAFAICCKIWNHPDILATFLSRRRGSDSSLREEAELDIEDDDDVTNTSRKRKTGKAGGGVFGEAECSFTSLNKSSSSSSLMGQEMGGWDPFSAKGINYSWAEDVMKAYTPSIMDNGYKISVAFAIIEAAVAQEEKVLLFSQSLFTLDLIEDYLSRRGDIQMGIQMAPWRKNTNYFRLDGSTTAMERQRLIGRFETEPGIGLFLISTRAGSLGINLTAANRAIVFDASWNPCHDTQAICRIFRYGQGKETFVYRLVTDNSMERSIFNRQLGKMGMADRVVDSKASDPNVTRAELRDLLSYDAAKDEAPADWAAVDDLGDAVLHSVLASFPYMLSQAPVRHESLLVEGEERGMSKAEMRRAQAAYERELFEMRGIPDRDRFAPPPPRSHMHLPFQPPGQVLRPFGFGNPHPGLMKKPMGIIRPQSRGEPPMLPQFAAQGMHIPPRPMQLGGGQEDIGPPLRLKHIICSQEASLPSFTSRGSNFLVRPGMQATIVQTLTGVYLRLKDGYLLDAAGSVYDVRQDAEFQSYPPPRRGPISNRMPGSLAQPPEVVDLCDSD